MDEKSRQELAAPGAGEQLEAATKQARGTNRWLALVPLAIGAGSLVALVVLVNPGQVGQAFSRFNVKFLPLILFMTLVYYTLQGARWRFLLRDAGVDVDLNETLLLNQAGQATALLPLGELSRAVFLSEAKRVPLGAVVATITVQELIYTVLLLVIAVPGLLHLHDGGWLVAAGLLSVALVVAVLTVHRLFRPVYGVAARTPGLRRFSSQVLWLHVETVQLVRQRSTLGWSAISVVQAAAMITGFWLVLGALAPGVISWSDAALVYAVSNIAGALSLIPGGIGAYEASVVGLLVASGLDVQTAAAGALIQRLCDKGFATLIGFAAYAVARRRFRLSGLSALNPSGMSGATLPSDAAANHATAI